MRTSQLFRRILPATAAVLLVSTAFGPGTALAETIDSFTTNQAALTDPPAGSNSTVTGGADIIGTRRGVFVDTVSGVGPTTTSVAAGVLNFAVTATTPDSRGFAQLTWDGDLAATVLDPVGLAGVNLADSNHSSFRIVVNSASAGAELEMDVYSSATDWSRGALRLPAVVAATSFYLSYATDFVTKGGIGADFANVGAIVLRVRGTEVAAAIDLIETVGPSVDALKRDLDLANNPIVTPQLPGSTIRYRVTITNTSGQAAAVDLADTLSDANLDLLPATVDAAPIAVRDAYSTPGHVGKTIAAAAGLLANDSDPDTVGAGPELTVTTTGAIATALGGTATVAADGSFTYEPPIGVGLAVDRFDYSIQDNEGGTASSEAVITLGRKVWFVDDVHPGTQTGTRDNPFVTITAANINGVGGVGDLDGEGDIFYFYDGGHTTPNLQLEASQDVVGAGIALVVDGETILPAGTHPTLNHAAGHVITLAANNSLRGLHLGNAAAASNRLVGANFGTLTISDASINGTGGAMSLTTGTLAANLSGITATAPGVRGILLDAVGGTLAVSGSTTISASVDDSIRITNAPSGSSYTFGTGSLSTNGAASGLELEANNLTASTTFGSLAVTTNNGAGVFGLNGGTLNVGGTGNTVSATGGPAFNLTSMSLGAGATFSTVSSTNSATTGVSLDTVSGPFTGTGGAISGSTGIGFDLNAGSANVTYAGTIGKSTAGRLIEVTSRTGGTTSFSGNLTSTGTSGGLNVASNTGGTINFSASTKTFNTGANAAVTLVANAGTTINFTGGGLDIDTTSGAGFTATGGAAGISVQGSGNSINSGVGTALNVVSTTIAAVGLTFVDISANGGTNGIVLNATGTNGGLRVDGTGSTDGSGGNIRNTSGDAIVATNAINLDLRNMDIGDGTALPSQPANNTNNIGGHGINLNGVTNVDLTNVTIARTGIHGINGTDVTDLAIADSEILNAGDGNEEHGLNFATVGVNNLDGTVSITNTVIDAFAEDGVYVENFSGTLNLTFNNVTVGRNANTLCGGVTCGENGLHLRADAVNAGTFSTMNIDVLNSNFPNVDGNGIFVVAEGAKGTVDFDLQTTRIENSTALGVVLFGGDVVGNPAVFNFNISNMSSGDDGLFNINSHAISILPNGSAIMRGSVTGTRISGSNIGYGIEIPTDDDAKAVITLSNNTITTTDCNGIHVLNGNTAELDVHIRNNSVGAADDSGALGICHGIEVNARETSDTCLDIANNASAGVNGAVAFRLRQRDTSVFSLERLTTAGNNTANIVAFLQAQNNPPAAGQTASATLATTYTQVADGACEDP
jgi:hypothetical protein